MWWPRSDQALMCVDATTLRTCLRPAYGKAWRAIDPMLLDAQTPTALGSAINAQLRKFKPSTIELVLGWNWAPGIVVDFGTSPMPKIAGDALARLRMQEAFGAATADWKLIQDLRRLSGPRSVFGVHPTVLDAACSAAKTCGVPLRRIEPALTWSWRTFAHRSVQSCWWIVDHEHGVTVVQVRQGVPYSIDHLPIRCASAAFELEHTIARLAIRRAVTDANTLPMHWVHSGGFVRTRVPTQAIVKCLHGLATMNNRTS